MRRISLVVISLAASAATVAACGSSLPDLGNNPGGATDGGGGTNNPNPTTNDGSSVQPIGTTDSGGNNNTEDGGGSTNEDSGGSTTPVFDGGPVSTVYPAPHPAWPQIVDQGGPVLTAPSTLTVTFNTDTNATTLDGFGAQATSSTNAYWTAVRQGYCETGSTTACVGTGTGTSVKLTETLAASYTDSQDPTDNPHTLETFIQSLVTAKKITIADDTLPIFYFPATTSISLDGALSCQQFGGYHNSMLLTGKTTPTAYAIVPECAAQTGETAAQALQQITLAASHEIIEAATDPVATDTTIGFYLNFSDPAFLPWNSIGGGEVGDMCVDFWGLGQDAYTEDTYTVQRIWNNAAAAAGGDPCVPAQPATNPYFNIAVEQWLVEETVGSTTYFAADAFSNMAVPSGWNVIGYDLNATGSSGSAFTPYLSISVNGLAPGATTIANVNNGQKAQIGVTLTSDPGSLVAQSGGAIGLLLSFNGTSPSNATAGTAWPFLVTTPIEADDAGLSGVDASEDMPRRKTQIKPIHLSRAQLERAWKNVRAAYK